MRPGAPTHSSEPPLPLLVTGIAGVAGYNALHYFRRKYGAQVVGIRRKDNWPLRGEGIVACDGDDRNELARLFDKHQFAAVLNCEGTCKLKSCELAPEMARRVNVESVTTLLDVIGSAGTRVVHLSIDLVFSGTRGGGHVETDGTDPVTVYGKTMAEAERIFTALAVACVVGTTGVVYAFGVYSPAVLATMFGVGFYAAFIVADRVVVTSRKAGVSADEGVRWESDGKGEYTVETVRRKHRGTEVVLHLKEDAKEFADGYRLREICKRYSDHVALPIRMPKSGDEKGHETINQGTALWRRAKQDIQDDEYKAFYKHVAHDFGEPLGWVHSKVEGKLEYTSLLYLPERAPFDLWDRDARHGVKLYVQRVFIMDDAEALLPRYLRFVRGVIETNDLPLNVSREILQHNKVLESIRSASVKKVLGLVESLVEDGRYPAFWRAFGRVLKEGVI